VARVLIVGCGCRGQALAGALVDAGHAVRGTARDPARLADIEASGAQGVVADPDRLGTIMGQLAGVSVVCWLMGGVDGESAADLHGPRLETLLERLVDTPVRGLVYEGVGPVDAQLLRSGARLVREAGRIWRMPVAVSAVDPADRGAWLAEMHAAVAELLSAEC
jgi:threonine dehydrogenase-like Zn-dependent dehydrogenase